MKRLTEGVRRGDRQERVIASVLRATAEALADSGYGGLRVEDVAARSGVNKTTIYRRWPTKADLVAATVDALRPHKRFVDSGDLRKDLVAAMRWFTRYARTPIGRGIVRMLQAERSDPAVDRLARDLKRHQGAATGPLVEGAIARGELPRDVDPEFVNEVIFGSLFSRLITWGDEPDDAFITALVETVVAGVRARARS